VLSEREARLFRVLCAEPDRVFIGSAEIRSRTAKFDTNVTIVPWRTLLAFGLTTSE
jgi:hypothetical protein